VRAALPRLLAGLTVGLIPTLLAAAAPPRAPAGISTPAPTAPPRPDPVPAVSAALAAAPPPGAPRAAAASAPLLGAPYLLSPLGEGRGEDPDPRFRLDAFDCVTFVETALALGSAATLDEARRALDDIRYAAATADIAERNHEVLSQWIPSNLAKGWIAPVSREVAGAAAVVVRTEYTAARWRRLRATGQRLAGVPPERDPLGRFQAEVVPPAALLAAASRIPEGTIAFVVRGEREDRLTRVSHAGLVVVRDGRRLVRHASSWPGVMEVVEEPLADFLRHQRLASRRPLTGLALFRVLDGRARLASLVAADGAAGAAAPAPPAGPRLEAPLAHGRP